MSSSTSGQSELITEECTALSFILDHLLPPTQTIGDRDCPALSRVLFAALASATHTPEVQQSLVNEVKSALHRALILPESNEKHARIQALTSLISTMIESCPAPTTASSSQQNVQNSIRSQTSLMNAIVKNLLRRGLVTDLARVTHSLDLSSPNMAQTVNATLKPLETLSRIVNIPPQMAVRSGSGRVSQPPQTTANTEAMEEDVTTTLNNSQTVTFSVETENPTENMNESTVVSNDNTFADLQRENTSDANEFVSTEAAVDDNVDNDYVAHVLDSVTFDQFNDVHHPRSGTFASDEIRTDDDEEDQHTDEIETEDHNEEGEHHENVVNSNGAESESGDESQSDDDDDDDDDGSGADEERDDEDDDEDDDDEHIDDDDDDDPEEDDEASAYVDHDELGDQLFRYHDRDDGLVFDLEEMFPTSVLHVGDRLSTLLPIIGDEHTNGTDSTQPTVPPAPGNVSISHPLLVRHGDATSGAVLSHSATSGATTSGILANRSHRSGRQRIYRPSLGTNAANHHSWHIPSGTRHPNPPAILQRLLGPNTAQDILQLTSSSGLGTSSAPAQVILTSNDFHILATDDELFELQNPSSFISGNASSTLGSVPSAMLRWTEESRVLDGDSLHDCVSLIKKEIIDCLEKHRDEELNEKREKKKKEEEAKRAAEEETKSNEPKPETNEQMNITTEKLAASLVEQVLGPAIQTTARNEANPLATPPTPPVSMEVTETTNGDMNSVQTDNEVTEMVCTEAQVLPSMPPINRLPDFQPIYDERQMEVNQESADTSLSPSIPPMPALTPLHTIETPTSSDDTRDRPPPPIRRESDEIGSAITPEDLSTITNTSSEGLNIVANDDQQNDLSANAVVGSTTPEAGTVVEVQTNDEPTPSNPNSTTPNTNTEFSHILGGKSYILLICFGFVLNFIELICVSDQEIPEGVDPSFLAALPENIRQEVIAEHLRLQRIQQQRTANNVPTTQATSSNTTTTFTEVNPEFLAALPPNIQEEVLAQQRAEQQRIQAQNTNPETPVDAGNFIGTLPPGLRRQVLADMDDSQLALLPPDVASEAQTLRQELEARHRQIQERFFSSHAGTALSRILRSAGMSSFYSYLSLV